MKTLPVILLATACGGGFSDADTKSATEAVRAEAMIERLCAPGAACEASQVRALERATMCANASMLARHGKPVPDLGGVACQPK